MPNGELDCWLRGQNSGRLFLSLNECWILGKQRELSSTVWTHAQLSTSKLSSWLDQYLRPAHRLGTCDKEKRIVVNNVRFIHNSKYI
jgi:hypothetical protein